MEKRLIPPPPEGTTLVDLLQARAAELAEGLAYTFLADGEVEEGYLSYAGLNARARAIAALLQKSLKPGDRALLLYPSGLDFIAAFFGCLYAGVIAVPAYPPRSERMLPRLLSIIRDARPAAALTTSDGLARTELMAAQVPGFSALRWLASDRGIEGLEGEWESPRLTPDHLAFLQYTSGSTSTPKGVMVSHGNLLHNEEMIRQAFHQSERSVIVGWLPMYHDMGLIGNVLQPLYVGGACVLMSPVAFLQKPLRWLDAISRYQATTSGGPNFAYELCVRKIAAQQREGLDLSSWEVAYNGAEPVRAASLATFAETYAPYGFRRETFYPCYGLAEATLFVSGGTVGAAPRSLELDTEALEAHRVAPLRGGGRELISCGRAWMNQEISIVDPASSRVCAPGAVGEIWLRGLSVARGYWQRPEQTERDFGARLAGEDGVGPFLRTGDLGFVHDGELYVTGRLKDLIILRGRNHYPQDIEETVERAHPALRPGCGAAFAADVEDEERLVLVWELERNAAADVSEVGEAVRRAVAEDHEVQLWELVLLRYGTVPKTTSGKIQRHAARAGYLEGKLEAVGRYGGAAPAPGEVSETAPAADQAATAVPALPGGLAALASVGLRREVLLVLRPEERLALLLLALQQEVARIVRVPVAGVDPRQPLTSLGLDSLAAVELQHRLEEGLKVTVPLADLLEGMTFEGLARHLLAAPEETARPLARASAGEEMPLSRGQTALWFLHRLAPESGAYQIAVPALVRPALDTLALGRALGALAARHPALRSIFGERDGEPFQRVLSDLQPELREVDATSWGLRELRREVSREAERPFDLGSGPLLRLTLFHCQGGQDVILLAVHHLVADFWSMGVLSRELGALYAREIGAPGQDLPALSVSYFDYVLWQRERLAGPEGERLGEFWERYLEGPLDPLDLPFDRPRPPLQTWAGATRSLVLGPALSEGTRTLARAAGATPFMTLLTVFQALLYRYTGQADQRVGSPTAGRGRPEFAPVVGYFAGPLVLRTRVDGRASSASLVETVRRTALHAFAHQDYPFPLVVERLQLQTDPSRSPLFQVMFVLDRAPFSQPQELAAFAVGRPGVRLSLGGLTVESLGPAGHSSQFDMTLRVAELERGLFASLQYNTDLFDDVTADRLLGHYRELLAGAAADPARALEALPLMTEAEREQVLDEWNRTARPADGWDGCLHELFETRVECDPGAVAVVFEGRELTYGGLEARANQLAHYLRRLGVGPEVPVGISMERSLDMVVALLGVLKAGGAYVPLDPAYPADRLAYMRQDVGTEVLLVGGAAVPAWAPERVVSLEVDREAIAAESSVRPRHEATPLHLAYVLYTSGSTGRPKGVQIPHGAVVNFLFSMARRPGLTDGNVMLALTTLSFDIAGLELFLPLAVGARVVVASREDAADPERLTRLLRTSGATVCQATPATWRMLVDAGWRADAGLKVLCGGEALTPDLAGRLLGAGVELWNLYGPTETTIWSAALKVETAGRIVPVGPPIQETCFWVVDPRLEPLPVGVPGELWIGGEGVARGYRGRPDLTAERFVPDPFASRPGARAYRTGDLVRWLPTGVLEFLGRIDHQVKLRGFRIELGEIEAALESLPTVRAAIVVAREARPGEKALVAYVVPRDEALDTSVLRNALAERLPEYMLPAVFIAVAEFPLTPSGKVDRRALPAPEWKGEEFVAPRTSVEEVLAGIWGEVLEIERVGIHDSFFALGGHSLLATRLVSRMRDALGVELSVRALFEAPTIARLAATLDPEKAESAEPEAPPIERFSREAPLPLSFAQERMWFLDQLEPGSPVYNMPGAVRLTGRLRVEPLAAALNEIAARHETLRTTFMTEARGAVQAIAPPAGLPLPLIDLSHLKEADREAEACLLLEREAERPFELAHGPLTRAALVRLGSEDHLFLVTLHHIISDGWSIGVLIHELSALYGAFVEGRSSPLPPLPVQYGDFAVWQRRWLTDERLEPQLAWWRERLAGAPPVVQLPSDRPRPAVATYQGGTVPVALPGELSEAVDELARSEGATPFMVLLAAFEALLARSTDQPDIPVGIPIAHRTRPEIEGLIGLFVNTLVLRVSCAGEPSFRDLLARAREAFLGAFAHQDLPFEKLVEALQPERSIAHSPLFQVMLAFQNARPGDIALPGVTLATLEPPSRVTKFDLHLSLGERSAGLSGSLSYSRDLFDAATAERLVGHWRNLLTGAVTNLDQPLSDLPLLTEAEREQIAAWNATAVAYPHDLCVYELVEAQVERTPGAPALVFEGETWTYRRLNAEANRLAHRLRGLDVGPEVRVGVCVERSFEMVVGLLAVLKAGGAYVPIDPTYPGERLAYMLADSSVPVLLTQERLLASLPEHGARVVLLDADLPGEVNDANPNPVAGPDNLAYVIYTSGSTGRPKGAMNSHRGVVNRLLWMQEQYGLTVDDRVLQKTPFSFDVSVWEFFWPLLVGARLVFARPGGHQDPSYLVETIVSEGITTLHFVPSMLQVFIETNGVESCASLRRIMASGEALPWDLLQRCHARLRAPLHNLYGPTEAAVDVTWWPCDPADHRGVVPIGWPVANTQIHLVDRGFHFVPVGVAGELLIGGVQVGRGYHNRPELTAEKFVPDPFAAEPGARVYRTGDQARRLATGEVEYLGRLDHQVKIRGFRIELGEIESALVVHPAVREAVVVVRRDRQDDPRLAAYWVAHGTTPSAGELRAHLLARLPEYMVPSAFVQLEALPLSPNGKVDRAKLPVPEMLSAGAEEFVAPHGPVQELLAQIWVQVLGIDRVGAQDRFFDLGGHSLLATQMISRVREAFGAEVPLRRLFERPTLAAFAGAVEQILAGGQAAVAAPVRPAPRDVDLPLSFAQERLWFLDQLDPGSAWYNIPLAASLSGRLDEETLADSLRQIVCRHEVLRTTFDQSGGRPVQRIAPTLDFALTCLDLSDLPQAERETRAREWIAMEAARPFDLGRGPLVRAHLLRLEPEEHILFLNLHHIVGDRWSIGVLLREIAALYPSLREGNSSPLPELPVQYADFAVWQRERLAGEALERELSWWREQLAGIPTLLELPTDRPRPACQSYRGETLPLALSEELSAKLRDLALQEGATLFMLLLAGFQALISRYSGQRDLLVGSPIAGRTRAELEPLIGFFANTVVLRGDLSGDPDLRTLLQRVRETTLSAYAHQDLPFEKLVEELEPQRNLSHSPLFQVVFVLQNAPLVVPELPGLVFQPLPVDSGTAKFDLTVSLEDTGRRVEGWAELNLDLFDPATVLRMTRHLAILIEGMVGHPERRITDLDVLSATERAQLTSEWNDTATPAPLERCIHELFEEQAAMRPDDVAVVWRNEVCTYVDLDARANRLARYLRRLGVGPDVPVGFFLERSLDMVVATLAILKAGGFYVPLDPSYPAERIALMVEDVEAPVLLSRETLARELPAGAARVVLLDAEAAKIAAESADRPESDAIPDNLAYVMYTSGSTGRPKGVAVYHRGVVRLVCGADYIHFGPDEVFLQLAPVSFDAATFEIWGALLNGGRLVVFPSARPSLEELGDVLEECGITTLWLTSGLFHQMVEQHLDRLSGLGQLLTGGDVVSPVHVQRVLRELPGCRLINGYGPTESTTFTTCYPIRPTEVMRAPVPVGRPIAHTSVHVLDSDLRPVPLGVPGELCIGGGGLARGYLNRPELTAERFVPDPMGRQAGGRLYRTGDRVRLLADGRIDFLGRFDRQVKLRGFRIELGEIESLLSEHPAVREAVLLVREDLPGGRGLVAYVVPDSDEAVTPTALREFLGAQLPDYMVPSVCILLPALPLTANGKVDRAALPASERNAAAACVAPRTPAEARVAELFSQVLDLPEPLGVEADFFELGGHSLLATQLVSRLREAFGMNLPLRSVFEMPTVERLARLVEAGRLEDKGGETAEPLLRRMPHNENLPLSFTQERLWFLDQIEPGGATYTIPGAVRLTGRLDTDALCWSLGEVVRRHEVLRSAYGHSGGRLVQRIAPTLSIHLPVTDLGHLPAEERWREVERLTALESEAGFDLATGPLLRAGLLHLSAQEHVLVINLHHIVADGWSLGVLVREVSVLYAAHLRGERPRLPEPAIQYADFARWQRVRLRGAVLEEHLAWWRERLAGEIPVLKLPTDRPRPRLQTFRGADQALRVDASVAERLRGIARSTGSTMFMTLLTAFKVLLHRQTGQEDLLVGSPVAGRDRAELEELIGPFINTLVLRTDLSGRPTFLELLARLRESALGALNHRELPFEMLLEAIQPERDASRTPLFQVLFNMLNFPGDRIVLPGLTLEYLRTPDFRSKFDMTIYAAEQGEEIHFRLVYNADLFDPGRIAELLAQFGGLLAQIGEFPGERIDRYSLVTPAARRLLPDPSAMLHVPAFDSAGQMFLDRAAALGDQPALRSRDWIWSYADLRQQALGVAHTLRQRGVAPRDAVVVYGPRSPELIASLLGVFLSAGVLLNLDRRLPQGRLRAMVRGAKARFVVCAGDCDEDWFEEEGLSVVRVPSLPDREWSEADLPRIEGDDPAYIFFTSGSTGVPKGVLGRQKGLSHFLTWQRETFGVGPGDRAAQLTGLSFDVVLRDILVPLTSGATLCLPDSDDLSAEAIFPWMQRIGVTILHTVPSLAGTWLSRLPEGSRLPELRWAFFAGEPLHDELVRRWRAALGGEAGIVNLYGPTETTLAKCYFRVPDPPVPGIQPVGSPLPQSQALVLGPGGDLCGIGEPGEIVIRTPFRSLGYINAAEEDRQRFRRNPFRDDGEDLVYFSGDRGRYRLDGSLEILGRSDDQIKIRGMRVEPAEIKAVIGRQPEIAECTVIAREDVPGDQRLVAYVVPRPPTGALDIVELRERLRQLLPDYMIPSAFVELATLPLNANGKVDRRSLPAPSSARPQLKSAFQAPTSELERSIAAIWKEILHLNEVGLHDRFFDLGGHSLQLVQLQASLEEKLQTRVPIPELFNHATVGALARYLGGDNGAERAIRQVDDRAEHLELGKARRKQRLEKRQRGQ